MCSPLSYAKPTLVARDAMELGHEDTFLGEDFHQAEGNKHLFSTPITHPLSRPTSSLCQPFTS